ncbi:hypothetical protein FKM82_000794 [Ascaphus truei]
MGSRVTSHTAQAAARRQRSTTIPACFTDPPALCRLFRSTWSPPALAPTALYPPSGDNFCLCHTSAWACAANLLAHLLSAALPVDLTG